MQGKHEHSHGVIDSAIVFLSSAAINVDPTNASGEKFHGHLREVEV